MEDISRYIQHADLQTIPGWQSDQPYQVTLLAQGEYNLNYNLIQNGQRWVVRVNLGTQIGQADQIAYEFHALQLLQGSGVAPQAYYLDAAPEFLPGGMLIMEYLPGEPLEYRRDLEDAARLFARLHTHPVDPAHNHLIRESRPLSMAYDECASLLGVYFRSVRARPDIREYLSDILARAEDLRHQEAYFLHDPWLCVINTEVNSGNFIANRETGSLHLVDWEKPLWGDPSQDLSHFCAPTTTLWKTRYRMSHADRQVFLDAYRRALPDRHLQDTIEERVRLRDPFNRLRGIAWSAMAWVAYQDGFHKLQNPDTFQTINSYLELDFLRELFEPSWC